MIQNYCFIHLFTRSFVFINKKLKKNIQMKHDTLYSCTIIPKIKILEHEKCGFAKWMVVMKLNIPPPLFSISFPSLYTRKSFYTYVTIQ